MHLYSSFRAHEFDTKHVANNSTYQADDNYWIFGPLTTADRSGAWTQALGAALDPELGDPAKGHVVSQKTSSGYSIEMRLPWSIFEPFFWRSPHTDRRLTHRIRHHNHRH